MYCAPVFPCGRVPCPSGCRPERQGAQAGAAQLRLAAVLWSGLGAACPGDEFCLVLHPASQPTTSLMIELSLPNPEEPQGNPLPDGPCREGHVPAPWPSKLGTLLCPREGGKTRHMSQSHCPWPDSCYDTFPVPPAWPQDCGLLPEVALCPTAGGQLTEASLGYAEPCWLPSAAGSFLCAPGSRDIEDGPWGREGTGPRAALSHLDHCRTNRFLYPPPLAFRGAL